MERLLIIALAVALFSTSCTTERMPNIERFKKDLAASADGSARMERVEDFMQRVQSVHAPVLEDDTTAVFIYRGPAERVRITGDMTQWDGEIALERITGTDVFYYRGIFPASARMEYMMLVDDGFMGKDPLNPHVVLSGFGGFSELAMPWYAYHAVFQNVRDGTPGGYERLVRHVLPVGIMDYATEVHVYAPPGYDTSSVHYPVVFILDGRDYIEFAHTPAVLDSLILSGVVDPVLAVFVSPPNRHQQEMPNRMTEYGLNSDYARFMAEEIVPFVEERYRGLGDQSARLVAGDSYAGLASVFIPFQHSEVFGLSYSQSGYLSLQSDSMIRMVERAAPRPVRFFVDVGLYEEKVGKGWLPESEINFLKANRRFSGVLAAMGYDYVYREYPEGHTWGNWRAHLMDALVHFFAASELGSSSRYPQRNGNRNR